MKNDKNNYSPPTSIEENEYSQKAGVETKSAKYTEYKNRVLFFAIIVTALNIITSILKANAGVTGLTWDTFYFYSKSSIIMPLILATGAQFVSTLAIQKVIFFYVYSWLSVLILIAGIIYPIFNVFNMDG